MLLAGLAALNSAESIQSGGQNLLSKRRFRIDLGIKYVFVMGTAAATTDHA